MVRPRRRHRFLQYQRGVRLSGGPEPPLGDPVRPGDRPGGRRPCRFRGLGAIGHLSVQAEGGAVRTDDPRLARRSRKESLKSKNQGCG